MPLLSSILMLHILEHSMSLVTCGQGQLRLTHPDRVPSSGALTVRCGQRAGILLSGIVYMASCTYCFIMSFMVPCWQAAGCTA